MIYDWEDIHLYCHNQLGWIILISATSLFIGLGTFVAIILSEFE